MHWFGLQNSKRISNSANNRSRNVEMKRVIKNQTTPFFNLTISTFRLLSLHLEIHSKRSLTCCQHKIIENCPIISVFDHKTAIYWSIFPIKKRKTVPHTHNLRDIPFTQFAWGQLNSTIYLQLKTQNSLLKTHYSKLTTQNYNFLFNKSQVLSSFILHTSYFILNTSYFILHTSSLSPQ